MVSEVDVFAPLFYTPGNCKFASLEIEIIKLNLVQIFIRQEALTITLEQTMVPKSIDIDLFFLKQAQAFEFILYRQIFADIFATFTVESPDIAVDFLLEADDVVLFGRLRQLKPSTTAQLYKL